ncbi:uncharacterized protein LAJ45_11502 [Morchella importuna]|uniref:Uncharacterized protein n=1 Tax=Morchella conica CCBAS932 TaxID=1392247 RepID=A0A3N4K7D4_9PEZI|nr:uncharacterized protein LAJ45_11502 [Morchella importuna]KAH8144491.1 hypothetical protein LAJ45_11502 [Morchella importuna]RPB06303.1 hypothetical protein P167DRAFT_610169 [Morchella conica CCBAS932]
MAPFSATATVQNNTGQHLILHNQINIAGNWSPAPQRTIRPGENARPTRVEDTSGDSGAHGRMIYQLNEPDNSIFRFELQFHATREGRNEVSWRVQPQTNRFQISNANGDPGSGHHIQVRFVIQRTWRPFSSLDTTNIDNEPFMLCTSYEDTTEEEC